MVECGLLTPCLWSLLAVSLSYAKQSVFALGVLLSEIAIGEHPLPNYPGRLARPPPSPVAPWRHTHFWCRPLHRCADEYQDPATKEIQYRDDAVLPLPDEYPAQAVDLVRRMVACNPEVRPTLDEVVATLEDCAIEVSTDPAVRVLRLQLLAARNEAQDLRAQLREAVSSATTARQAVTAANAELAKEVARRQAAEAQVAALTAGTSTAGASPPPLPPAGTTPPAGAATPEVAAGGAGNGAGAGAATPPAPTTNPVAAKVASGARQHRTRRTHHGGGTGRGHQAPAGGGGDAGGDHEQPVPHPVVRCVVVARNVANAPADLGLLLLLLLVLRVAPV